MQKKIILIVLALIIVSFLAGYFIRDLNLTGQVVSDIENKKIETKTTALCKENKCVDVLVSCFNGQVENIELVSSVVEFSEDFVDLRNQTGLC